MRKTRTAALAACTLAVITGGAWAQNGRIVVANDEWTLSNTGFTSAADTPTYVENVCDWFTGGASGNFLCYSDNFGLTESTLAQTMAGLGHTWTVDISLTFDLATLAPYDAIFVGGFPADNPVLIQYVRQGGHVYVAGGCRPDNGDNQLWGLFLGAFGLGLSDPTNNRIGAIPIAVNHPLFHGVSALYQNNGTDVIDKRAADCAQQVLWSEGGNDLYAFSDSSGRIQLDAYSATYSAGDTLELHGGLGLADRRAVLVAEDISGTRVFIQIFLSKFGPDCRWSRNDVIPTGIPTSNVTLVLYGVGQSGKIEPSNPVVIPFP